VASDTPEQGASDGAPRPARVLIVGIGNTRRGDDAVGLRVARRLQPHGGRGGIDVLEHDGEPLALLEIWDGARAVVLVDAIRSGAAPGAIARIEASAAAVPASLRSGASTHAIGLAEAIELARALRRLPARVVVFGVEGRSFDRGRALSAEVEASVGALAAAVLREARGLAGGRAAGAKVRRRAAAGTRSGA
jgi:hydrogenase maturation protease